MPHTLYEVPVDIYQLPIDLKIPEESTEITIGDLHANTMKLLYLLFKHGIASNLDKAEYEELVRIYKAVKNPSAFDRNASSYEKTCKLAQKDIKQFDTLLNKIRFQSEIKPGLKLSLKLIGDELVDRGNLDFYTLKIFNALQKNKIPFKILISNHGIEFIRALTVYLRGECEELPQSMLSRMGAPFGDSFENMRSYIEHGIVDINDVIELYNKSYLPYLKILDYTLSADEQSMTIDSHAGIAENKFKTIIHGLATTLKIECKCANAKEVAGIIDTINTAIQEKLSNTSIDELFPKEALEKGFTSQYVDLSATPFVYLLWNRHVPSSRRAKQPFEPIFPFIVGYTHGHDLSDKTNASKQCFNLDNFLGKRGDSSKENNKGTYTVLLTTNGALIPQYSDRMSDGEDSTVSTCSPPNSEAGPALPADSPEQQIYSMPASSEADSSSSSFFDGIAPNTGSFKSTVSGSPVRSNTPTMFSPPRPTSPPTDTEKLPIASPAPQ